jgi:hypothetical protein
MNDDNLTDLLEARAADVPVGPAPLADMHRAASRRRRSYAVALAAAAAVVVGVGAVAVWPDGSGSDRGTQVATDSPSDPASSDVPPAGFRWVGIGQAAIAVPEDWPDNATRCGTPAQDTVVIDQGVVPLCMALYPEGVTSVEVRGKGGMDDVSGWSPLEVDGEEALRSPAIETETFEGGSIYAATLYLVERDVMFAAESSVSQEAADEVLTRVAILDALVAVPGISEANYGGEQRRAGENYVRTLEEAGLTAEVVTKRSGTSAGFVMGVSPTPGTVVEPGSVVTVTVAG